MNWISKFIKPKIKSLFEKKSSKSEENLWTTCGCKNLIYKDPNLTNLETELSDALGAKVIISHQKKGSGKITFSYKNLEQLDQIIKPLRKKE